MQEKEESQFFCGFLISLNILMVLQSLLMLQDSLHHVEQMKLLTFLRKILMVMDSQMLMMTGMESRMERKTLLLC